MKISSNNYRGFPHMFHVDMLDDSSPNCVDGTDSSPWFTLKKIRASGFWASEAWMTGVNFKMNLEEQEMWRWDLWIYIYILLYIYYIWEVPIARPCLVDEPILQKCLHDQLFWFLKFDYWIYQFVMFVVSLSSCTVVLMSFFPQLIPGPSRWFAVLDCTTCYLDKLLVSELLWLWFSQTWKSATLKSYEAMK